MAGLSEQRGVFFLFTTEGIGNQWKTVTLNKKEISFGRNEENDITIPLSYVSGKHMVIRRRDNEYFVMDCDSMAGTWLNGAKASFVHWYKSLRKSKKTNRTIT